MGDLNDLPGLTEFMNELWIFSAAIWATTQIVGPAIPKINNRVIALLLGVAYGLGAHFSGYLTGGLFVVVAIKTPIACIAAQLWHDRIFSPVKALIAGRTASTGVATELKPSAQNALGSGEPSKSPTGANPPEKG
jgi:hypothetical protein